MWALLRELLVYARLAHPTLLAVLSYLASFVTSRRSKFNPDADIPRQTGRIILVTGANGGIGKETVLQLAKHQPSRIFLAARNHDKACSAIADIQNDVSDVDLTFIPLDLTSFDSIDQAAKQVQQACSRLDLLILNAGIMATPYGITKDGYEAQLGTNYLGHALLTELLLPLMVATAALPDSDVRIVSVSSIGHHMAPRGGILFDHEATKQLTPAQLYGQSKLANILHAKSLARRCPKILSTAVHPGVIRTELYGPVQQAFWLVRFAIQTVGSLFFASVEFGALNQLWAATGPRRELENGAYYMPVGKQIGASKYALDVKLSERLWRWTEQQFTEHGVADSKKTV